MNGSPIDSPIPGESAHVTAQALQSTLVELINLSLVAKQAHWNVVGSHFRSVHLQLDELVALARTHMDEVAERAAAIGVAPDGRAATVAQPTGIPDFPAGWQSVEAVIASIVEILRHLIGKVRERIDETEKSDLVTQDLLLDLARELEQAHWMWQAQQAR